jgi:hypothetical protein
MVIYLSHRWPSLFDAFLLIWAGDDTIRDRPAEKMAMTLARLFPQLRPQPLAW